MILCACMVFFEIKINTFAAVEGEEIVRNTVASIEFECEPIKFIENVDGFTQYDKDGNPYDNYYCYPFSEGSKLTVYYGDGSSKVYTYFHDQDTEEESYVSADGEKISTWGSNRLSYYDNQYDDHWIRDKENYITITYMGVEDKIPVEIVESPVASIEFDLDDGITIFEEVNGWIDYDDDGNQFYHYDEPSIFIEGAKLTVHYKDETTKVYSYQHDEESGLKEFVSEDGETIPIHAPYNPWYDSDQENVHWNLGTDNYITLHYLDVTCPVPVEIVGNPIGSIEYTSAQEVVFIEGKNIWSGVVDGYRYFEDCSYYPSAGDKLTLHYKDNSIKTYTYDTEKEFVNDTNSDEILHFYDFDYWPNQSENAWEYGPGNDFSIIYCGKETTIKVTYRKDSSGPSADEIVANKAKALIEAANGDFKTAADAQAAVNAAKAAFAALTNEQKALLAKMMPDAEALIQKAQDKATDQANKEKPAGKVTPATVTPTATAPAAAAPKVGNIVTVAGSQYKVASTDAVTLMTPKNGKTTTVPATVTVSGKTFKVTGIAKGAFKKSKATTLVVSSQNLTKKSVKGCLKGSKVKVVKVKVGNKKVNKKFVKKYKKIFSKKICGKKVKVK